MTSDASDDANVLVICSGRISPGCPTAGPILDGCSKSKDPQGPAPKLSLRASFGSLINPTSSPKSLKNPSAGSFILFQLNKQELARKLSVPEDSESLERCLALPVKRYVGLVVDIPKRKRDLDVEVYDIAFVGKSIPPSLGSSSESDSFAIPIAPTKRENIDGHQSLNPRPFPWTGCYQYTVVGARVVPTHVRTSAIDYRLNDEDFETFQFLLTGNHVTLDRQLHDEPPISDEEVSLFEAAIPLPVKVWCDLKKEEECHDPREFMEEALSCLRELGPVGDEEPSC